MKYLSKEELEQLPAEIVKKVKNTLKAYSETSIYFENGEYKEMTGCFLADRYAKDYKHIGFVKVEDIYTLEERTENYITEFHDYPYWYNGKRDYAALNKQFSK